MQKHPEGYHFSSHNLSDHKLDCGLVFRQPDAQELRISVAALGSIVCKLLIRL